MGHPEITHLYPHCISRKIRNKKSDKGHRPPPRRFFELDFGFWKIKDTHRVGLASIESLNAPRKISLNN